MALMVVAINPLTTNDDYSRHGNSATCYQLVQSVLKIGSALPERVGQGEVGECTTLGDSTWRLLQLAIVKAWSAVDDSIFGFLGFQSGGGFSGRKALTTECLVISGCGQGHEPAKNF